LSVYRPRSSFLDMLSVPYLLVSAIVTLICGLQVAAYDNTRNDNLAVYWGQDSYGATHSDVANFQKRLSFYCGSDSVVDAFPLAFVTQFFGPGGLPSIDLSNVCNPTDNATFPGSELPNCSFLAADIQTCQAKGKIVTLSMGGSSGAVGFTSDAQAISFADQVWNVFLGGSSSTRPFGNAVLDGVDLDIEGGGTVHFAAFLTQLQTHFSGASKKYYVTAAPQCPFPDGNLATVLDASFFDAVYVQFYNNFCGLNAFSSGNFNFDQWDAWAKSTSLNKNVKIFLGAPASTTAAGSGFVNAATIATIIQQTRSQFSSFGGVMMWDMSQAYANGRYDVSVKNALTSGGSRHSKTTTDKTDQSGTKADKSTSKETNSSNEGGKSRSRLFRM